MANEQTIQSQPAPAAVTPGSAEAVASAPALDRYRSAFERALPASLAIPLDDLIPINVDIPTVVATTVGKLPGILAFREAAKALAGFDAAAFDQLETYTLATGHAHSLYMGASSAPELIIELNERAMRLRNILYTDAVALAARNLIGGDRIGEFKANIGYKNLAFDLMALANVLRGAWDRIAGKTAITMGELEQAALLGDQLVSAVGARVDTPATVAEVSLQRQRNFTLFVNAYGQVRRAISFLRWDAEDLERIAPSLYSGRGNSNARSRPEPEPDAETETGGASNPTTGASANADGDKRPVKATTSPGTGLPNANPFDKEATS